MVILTGFNSILKGISLSHYAENYIKEFDYQKNIEKMPFYLLIWKIIKKSFCAPVATGLTRRLVSLMMGLWVTLMSSLPCVIVVLWHRSTSLSSCFCRSTRMSSRSNAWRSICFDLLIRHVNDPSKIILCRVKSRFWNKELTSMIIWHVCYITEIMFKRNIKFQTCIWTLGFHVIE